MFFDLWSPIRKLSLCLQPPVACSFTRMLKQRLGSLRKAILLWELSPGVRLWVLLVRRPCWYSSTVWAPLTSQSEPSHLGIAAQVFPAPSQSVQCWRAPSFLGLVLCQQNHLN